jgi:hypothetical protein
MLPELVERAVVPFHWGVADEHSGRIPTFLDGVAAEGRWYFAEVPASTKVGRESRRSRLQEWGRGDDPASLHGWPQGPRAQQRCASWRRGCPPGHGDSTRSKRAAKGRWRQTSPLSG